MHTCTPIAVVLLLGTVASAQTVTPPAQHLDGDGSTGVHVRLDPYVSGFIRYEFSFSDEGDVSGIAAGLSFAF